MTISPGERVCPCALDFKQQGDLALPVGVGVQGNESPCTHVLCQRKVVINTLQILLKEFPTYDKLMAPESQHFCAADSVV